jgi:hypothetical protein
MSADAFNCVELNGVLVRANIALVEWAKDAALVSYRSANTRPG